MLTREKYEAAKAILQRSRHGEVVERRQSDPTNGQYMHCHLEARMSSVLWAAASDVYAKLQIATGSYLSACYLDDDSVIVSLQVSRPLTEEERAATPTCDQIAAAAGV